jgi:hypothetical protein
MVFFAYFLTGLYGFINSYNNMIFGPSSESIEYNRELEKYHQWKGNVPSYAVTVRI